MLFRVTVVLPIAGQSEFPPQLPVLQYNQSVTAREKKELRSDPELLERDLRHHGKPSSGGVPLPKAGRFREDLDETLVPDFNAHPSQLGVGVGGRRRLVESGRGEEGVVNVAK